jgi:hypothetical protein
MLKHATLRPRFNDSCWAITTKPDQVPKAIARTRRRKKDKSKLPYEFEITLQEKIIG